MTHTLAAAPVGPVFAIPLCGKQYYTDLSDVSAANIRCYNNARRRYFSYPKKLLMVASNNSPARL